MKNAIEIIKIGVILFVITAVSAALLAVLNSVTAPIIAANQEQKQTESMKSVVPSAESFEETEVSGADDIVTGVYEARDSSGGLVGICVMASPVGYGGDIELSVGIDTEGKVTGVDIISMSETAGLGANASKDEFKGQYVGKTAGIAVTKNAPGENEISAISGATITSEAVTSGVNAALEAASTILNEEGGLDG